MYVSCNPKLNKLEVDGVELTIASQCSQAVPESAACLGLIPAIRNQSSLIIAGSLPDVMINGLQELSGIFSTWFGLRPISIQAETRPAVERNSSAASFFSGGVDSFYTAVTRPDVKALIFVNGFDLKLNQTKLREQAARHARAAANELGKEFIEVKTDMRKLPSIDADWGMLHGAAMASVAHSLASRFGKIYIPSTYTYSDATFPWGSHPLTDPIWSSDRMQIVHDGATEARFDKIGHIAEIPAVAAHLRVCWENRDGKFNCGRCEKCTRTMIALRAHGVLDRYETFEEPLRLNRVRFGELNHETQRAFTRQGIKATEDRDPKLAAALKWRLKFGRPVYYVKIIKNKVLRFGNMFSS